MTKLLSPTTKLFQCVTSARPWLLDQLNETVTSTELYFDWPKWARNAYQVPTAVFDFSVLLSGTLDVTVESVPKSAIGATLIVFNKVKYEFIYQMGNFDF